MGKGVLLTVVSLYAMLVLAMPGVLALIEVDSCQDLDVAGETYEMNASITNNSVVIACMDIAAPNITLDCRGYYIKSDDAFSGVYSNQLNTTIRNCNISMYKYSFLGSLAYPPVTARFHAIG